MAERLSRKLDALAKTYEGEAFDDAVDAALDAQEVLTVGLLPLNSKLRTTVVGCLMRSSKRKADLAKLKKKKREDDLVPVEVHGGGKCKITVFMTREAAERERRG